MAEWIRFLWNTSRYYMDFSCLWWAWKQINFATVQSECSARTTTTTKHSLSQCCNSSSGNMCAHGTTRGAVEQFELASKWRQGKALQGDGAGQGTASGAERRGASSRSAPRGRLTHKQKKFLLLPQPQGEEANHEQGEEGVARTTV